MVHAGRPNRPERPDWLADGERIAILYATSFREAIVARATATQVIVLDGGKERRYRLDDLREVGSPPYNSTLLVPMSDDRVQRVLAGERTYKAMGKLHAEVEEVTKQAAIYTRDPGKAREVAEALREAAQYALDNIPSAEEA